MAGDWIKVESTTPDKSEVFRMAEMLKLDADAVLGKLVRLWVWFDQHLRDGNAPSVTYSLIDRVSGHAGFSESLLAVGWLESAEDGFTIPNFDRHNGKTAKTRALTAKRVAAHKEKGNADGNEELTLDALPREEKRREELKALPTIVGSTPTLEILPSNIPYKEIVSLFNGLLGKLPMVRELTQKRRLLIRAAWHASKRRQKLDFWKRYFEECAEDPFLSGDGPYKPPHENWRPSFDFLMRSDQVTKVYERAMHEAGGAA